MSGTIIQAEGIMALTSSSKTVSRVRNRTDSMINEKVDPSYQPKLLKKLGSVSSSIDDFEGYSKVLVLYTGGTIGMKANKEGVYEPLTSNSFIPALKKLPMFHNGEVLLDLPEDSLFMTRTNGPPLLYSIYEYDPLLDSCNVTMDDWIIFAKDIKRNYNKFDGFVILHGTDTMAYTASALAFMLENLGKPVILTGAQIPIFEPRSDGRDNFLGALIFAGQYSIPEVCLYFNDTLFRGCRSTKIDNESFAAFSSPNVRPLAHVGIEILVHWNDIFKPYSTDKFCISTSISPHVGVLRFFPSISNQTVRAFLQSPMQGVVLESFGAGNGPSARKDILEALKEAVNRGVIIVNITQCCRGSVKVSYETGAALASVGVIAGSDMTPEAALTKLAYVIGKDLRLEEKKEMMRRNLRGELKITRKQSMTLSSHIFVQKVVKAMEGSSGQEYALVRDILYPSMMCAAAQEGKIDTLQELIDSGGNISGQSNYDGRTALHIAASEGKAHVVEFLLENGALVHLRDRYGETPLMNAIRFGHEQVVGQLVRTGAHLTIPKNKLGILLYNATMAERLDQLQCWLSAGADMSAENPEGRTVLHAAASIGSLKLVEWLLELDLDFDVVDCHGLSALQLAENCGHVEVAVKIKKAKLKKSSDSRSCSD